ncbi:hypothetical protein ACWD5R_11180 [Streptomyces sp. NPDC002514]|uniref:hypothetical protein n=1 Tax=Streptomyces sp. NPDC001270 TaxID=3364554 RepID=UPI0036787C81
MFTHRSTSSPPSPWCAGLLPGAGTLRPRRTGIPARTYDALLMFLVVLAVTHQMPGRGLLLAAFLVFRLTSRRLVHNRPAPSVPGRPDPGRRR